MSNFNNYSSNDQFSASTFVSQNYYSSNSSPSPSQFGGNYYNSNNNYNTQQNSNSLSQLWMGDLDPWWDENAIKQIWSSVGENTVSQVKLIYNRNIQANQGGNSANSGYCFLTFNSYQLAQQALTHNGTAIPGTNRFFKLNWASAGQNSQSSPTSQAANGQQEFSVFVGDLAPDVTDKTLFEFFQYQYPSCSSAKIMMDQITGNSRGYGFVKFTNELEQNKALLEMQSAILNGRPIRVSTATKNSTQSSLSRSGINQAQGLLQQQQQPKITIPPQQFNPPLNPFSDSNNTTVFIGGLNVPISAEELRAYFLVYGDIVYAKVLDGKNCGFVQYVNRVDAEKAMVEMQGFPLGTSRMRLAWGQKYGQQQQLLLQQQQQNNLYTSLLSHSNNNNNNNGFTDQNTYINGNYNFDSNSFNNKLTSPFISNEQANPIYSNEDYLNLKDLMLNRLNAFH